MNAKVCKRLRREANYHPSEEKRFQRNDVTGNIIVHPASRRSLYRSLKQEYRETHSA